jgi:hypothetical protein
MPVHKVTNFLSEISAFFKKDDAHIAMHSVMDVIKWLKMTELSLFGMKSKCNNVYSLLASVPGSIVISVFHDS